MLTEVAEELEPWMLALVDGKDDPLTFATGVMGFLLPGAPNPNAKPQLEPWQVKFLQHVGKAWRNRFKVKPRISVRSGHGSGKTCALSIVILWALCCWGRDTKIPVVASSQDQLRDGLWAELSKWMQLLPAYLKNEIEWQKERVVVKESPEECFAVRRTASKHRPEALQGFHATNLLAVLEEASGIPDETIEAGAGSMSTPGAMMIAVGNPTRPSGFFFKTHNNPQLRASWITMSVNSEDVPRARGHVEDIINTYGRESNAYRVRVLGEFPVNADDTVISLADVVAAKGRNVAKSHVYPIWGVDVGRHGDDPSTLVKRQGNTLIDVPKVWRNMNGEQVAGRIIAEYEQTTNDMKPKRINVDVIGVGSSVIDFLRRAGSPVRSISFGVNVAESAATSDQDRRLRDELWFKGRQWFADKASCIPANLAKTGEEQSILEQLIGELTSVTFDFDENGKRVVERKKDMKKRLGHSPDLADGFLLTFVGGSFPREADDSHRSYRSSYDDDSVDPWGS